MVRSSFVPSIAVLRRLRKTGKGVSRALAACSVEVRRHSNIGAPQVFPDPEDDVDDDSQRPQQQQRQQQEERQSLKGARETMLINSMEYHNILLRAAGGTASQQASQSHR